MTSITRRGFLQATAGGTAAVASSFGKKYIDKLVASIEPDPTARAGEFSEIATTCRECPAGCGMQVRHCDGRAIKAEGNPRHPINCGALCARGQSALQGQYDPDRLRAPQRRPRRGEKGIESASWEDAMGQVAGRLKEARRVILLSDLQTGSLAAVMEAFAAAFHGPRLLLYEAIDYPALRQGHDHVFRRPIVPTYRLDQCEVLVSFAVDFLETWVSPVEYAWQFAAMRALREGRVGRFLYVGPRHSMTAANADEVLLTPPGGEAWAAWAMLAHLAPDQAGASARELADRSGVDPGKLASWARRLAGGKGLALGGTGVMSDAATIQAAEAAALINHAAGQLGKGMDPSRPHALSNATPHPELIDILQSLGPSDAVFVHNTNPAYSLPGAVEWLAKAGLLVCLDTRSTETGAICDWLLPIDSPLESWGDYQPRPDVLGILQPTMGRIFDTRLVGDVLLELARSADRPLAVDGQRPTEFRELLWRRWADMSSTPREDLLRQGGLWHSESAPATGPAAGTAVSKVPPPTEPLPAATPQKPRLWLYPSILLFDGRTANRGWIQENPDPISYITWDSWVEMHPSTARANGLAEDDVVALVGGSGRIEAPIRVTEEIDPNTVSLSYGQGHSEGHFASGVGANAFMLLTGNGSGPASSVSLRATGRKSQPTYVSPTQMQHHRDIVQWVPLSKVREMKAGEGKDVILPLPEGYTKGRDMYPPHGYKVHRWAMSIDLHRCIGCQACAVACYAENNIGVVGRHQVGRGLEMAWLKVAPYRNPEDPRRLGWLVLPCQHCDAAPCEPVCPVFAAVHNDEGLNAQVYNRCIGTRYCSNNCPYKVRRFNWLNYVWPDPLPMQLNPNVTARCRGVMEKCTFCIQRIKTAEYRAKRENRPVREGEIVPACVQTCPAGVFTFGDLLDPNSAVSKITRQDPRRYHVLEELNTKPAVTYLRRLEVDEKV